MAEIVVHLSQHDTVLTSKRLHKLCGDALTSDIRPPRGVDVYELSQVSFEMSVSPWSKRSRKRKRQEPEVNQAVSDDEMLGWDERMLSTRNLRISEFGAHYMKGVDTTQDEFLEDMLFVENSEDLVGVGGEEAIEDSLLGRTGTVSQRTQDLCELMDAAIRSAISGKSSKIAGGIRHRSMGVPTTLSRLAPILFSPGYRPVQITL